jgi:hypothetical protein
MQKRLLYTTLFLIVIAACSKDKYQDKPTVEIKSIRPGQVPLNAPLEIEMEFTDKQGDLDSVFLHKVRINSVQRPVRPANNFEFKLPDFPEKSKGTIKVTLQYGTDLTAAVSPRAQADAPNGFEPDTLVFQIVVKDKSGNASDTTVTDPIVVERFN